VRSAGNSICDVLVILEPMAQSVSEFVVSESGKILTSSLREAGVNLSKVSFIISATEIPRDIKKIEKAAKEHVLNQRADFLKIFNRYKPKALLYVAKYAALQLFGRSVVAGEFEGIIRKVESHPYPIIGCTSIRNAALYKDSISLVKAQIMMFKKLVDNNFQYDDKLFKFNNNYEWRVDISDVLKNKPKTIAFDTETTGLDWKVDRPIVYQMTFAEGHSILSPVCESYFPEYFKETFGDFSYDALRDQWKQIIEDPEIRKVGHNIKFDMHMALNLGHRLRGLYIDTLQMLWSIDENMPSKGLDNAVKIFVPELAGYADNFNRETDKGQMITVHPKDMIDYAGGDTDATFRLCKTLIKIAKEDPSNLKVFSKVKMRAIETFFDMERTGIRVDVNYFDSISKEYLKHLKEESVEIIKLVPPKIRRKYMFGKKSETKEPLRLGNKEMMRDAIFSEDGLGIIPIPDKGYEPSSKTKEVKIPSIAVNTHLKFFKEQGYELIDRYCDYSKISKMSDTYTGDREKLTGLWQHIKFNEETGEYRIHPTYDIHTNTGRCLTGDTLVTVKQGRKTTTKRLDQIVVGDLTLTHKQRYMPVTKIFKNGKKEVYGVCLDNGSVLRGTLKHKLMLESGEFKQIQYLDYTDRLMTYTDGEFKGSKVNSFYYKKNDLVETFDIEVEEDHSYVANGIVSHNSNCKRPNMQNPPSKGDLAVQFKKSIITSDGFVLLAADYSQMELRCIAIAAKEKIMQQIYNEGLDIHAKTAAEVLLKITLEEFRNINSKLRKELRNKAKAIIFGFMYGLLPKGFVVYAKLLYNADFTLEEAEIIRETLLTQTYPGLQQWHIDTKEFANEHGYVKALHGSTRHLPAIHSHDKWVKLEAERYSVNSCIQEFGSDMGLMAFDYIMRDMSRDNIRPINFIHDALYFEVRKELAVEYASYVKWYMENVPIARDFGIVAPIPFVADPDLGVNWADVFTLAELELETKDKNKDFKLFCKEFNVTKEQASKYFCYNGNDIKMIATRPDFCTI
jgi:DNA polymerase I-like protein with 3'-5' exonuclease and polymerase domains